MSRHNEGSESVDEPRVEKGRIWFPITLVATIVGLGITVSWTVKGSYDALTSKIDRQSIYMRQLGRDCMTVPKFQGWLEDMRESNPALRIPRVQGLVEPAGSLPPESTKRGE